MKVEGKGGVEEASGGFGELLKHLKTSINPG